MFHLQGLTKQPRVMPIVFALHTDTVLFHHVDSHPNILPAGISVMPAGSFLDRSCFAYLRKGCSDRYTGDRREFLDFP